MAFDVLHADQLFLMADDTELAYVAPEYDTGEDRMLYGFGQICPIELNAGVDLCKSFKAKHNCCQSVVSETMARNYLARHAYDSSNHPTWGNKAAAFEAANQATMFTTVETPAKEDREAFRKHCDYYAEQKRQEADREERERERSRTRTSGRAGATAAKGSGGGRGKDIRMMYMHA